MRAISDSTPAARKQVKQVGRMTIRKRKARLVLPTTKHYDRWPGGGALIELLAESGGEIS